MTKLQVQNLAWTSTSNSWPNLVLKVWTNKFSFMTKLQLPNLHQHVFFSLNIKKFVMDFIDLFRFYIERAFRFLQGIDKVKGILIAFDNEAEETSSILCIDTFLELSRIWSDFLSISHLEKQLFDRCCRPSGSYTWRFKSKQQSLTWSLLVREHSINLSFVL